MSEATETTPAKATKAKAPKVITIIKRRRGVESEVTGTIEKLTSDFSYLLECGNSYRKSINRNPKTPAGLVSALNSSVRETQNTFTPDSYTLKK